MAPPSSVFITVPASPNYTITIRIKIYIEEQSCKFEKISRWRNSINEDMKLLANILMKVGLNENHLMTRDHNTSNYSSNGDAM